jgi:hypothetical protein
MLGMAVARAVRRKTATTRTTRPTVKRSVCSTSATEARIVAARSCAMVTSRAGETIVRSSGKTVLMLSIAARMFAPGWRRMIITTARSALNQAAARRFSTSSKTLATSRSRTTAPSSSRRTRSPKAAAPNSWLSAEIVKLVCAPWRVPFGAFDDEAFSLVRTSASESPCEASFRGSTCTRTAGCCPPPT